MSANFNFYLNRQGAQGRQGEQGEAGYSPTISVDTNTAAEYKLRIQNETTSFVTPNLRGNAIEDTGGTYVRYNPVTQMFETGFIDQATPSSIGGVLITPVGGLEAGGTDVDVPTSAEVYDYVESKITSIGEGYVKEEDFANSMEQIASELDEKISFDNLASSLVEGSNITLDVDSENNTITINATGGDLSNYVTLDTVQTITNSKTFDGNGTIHFSNISNGVYFKDSSSTERIRIFTARHSSGADYSDLTMQSYSDMQFRLLSPATTVKLTDIITSNTLANSAVQPADLADYAKLNQMQFFTELQNFSGGISLPTGNSINFHSPTTGSSGIISSPSANTLQLRANTININSGGSSPIVKNLFDMIQLSDLSIASASSNWLNYDNSTGEFSANVDTVVAQNSNNLITSGAVHDGLEAKADVSQTHALKSYSDEGELLTDAEGLANVKNYANSTFDLSKFTVAGSPTITDDGIASGFSTSNRLVLPTITIDNKDFEFYVKIKTPAMSSTQDIFGGSTPDHRFILGWSSQKKFYSSTVGDFSFPVLYTASTLEYDTEYYVKTGVKNNIYYLSYSIDGVNWTTTQQNVTNQFTDLTNMAIGNRNPGNPYLSSIDLKQCSITVDGVEVFSGNKTGIDTIKPDDYTVVGTPDITDDGTLELDGTNNRTNYIKKSISLFSSNNSFKLYLPIKITELPTTAYAILYLCSSIQINLETTGQVKCLVRSGTTESPYWDIMNTELIPASIVNQKQELVGVIEWTGEEYILGYIKNGAYTNVNTITSAVKPNSVTEFNIGMNQTNVPAYSGSIDLNSFKIYVDGNLVYQPCLKIPYTESKTGSKIVDSVYCSRVNDMAEQFGYANYYTLDEDNSNFTLPMGELYGLMGDKTLRDSYYNGVTYWELFSNRRLEQGGTCESGVEYTFPKPFADTNYILTIPYSSKTATSFIPSATGDFIAKGTGLL